MFMARLRRWAVATSVAILLSGCGGDSDPLREDEGKVSFYSSGFSWSQALFLITFEGGLTYGFYQSDFSNPIYPEYAYAGFFVARPQTSSVGGNREGWDFDFDAESVSPMELSPPTENEATFAATLQSPTRGSATIVGSRSPLSELLTDPASLPGDYALQARSTLGSFKGNATLNSSGALVANDLATCHIEATLSPRPLGNLYDVTARVGPGCAIGSGEFSGHGIQAYATKLVYLLLADSSASVGIMLLLTPR